MQDSFIFAHVLNTYDVLLLTTFVLSVVLAMPLFLKRDRQIHDVLLALFVLSQGGFAFYTVMLYNQYIGPHTYSLLYPFYKTPFLLMLGIQGLLLLWYVRAMVGQPLRIRSNTTWVMGMFTLFAIGLNVYLSTLQDVKVNVLLGCSWLLSVFSMFLGFKAIKQLQGYELQLPFIHSNLDKHSLIWLKSITGGFVFVWLVTVLAVFADGVEAFKVSHYLHLFRHMPPLVLLSAMVFYSQTHAVSRTDHLNITTDAKSDADAYAVNHVLTERLSDLMERVKVYQDPELRLEGLADSLDISPRSLSTLLNRHYQQNFYDFVNQYRVMDAQAQLKSEQHQEKTIQRVFEDAGFNSKTTFNTLFKRYTGQTPSAYKKANHCEVAEV